VIVRVFQHSDGNILCLLIRGQGLDCYHQFVLTDVVINKNKIGVKAYKAFQDTSQVERDLSNDLLTANLLEFFKYTTHFNRVVANQKDVDGIQRLGIF
jgi:hypothetical protein